MSGMLMRKAKGAMRGGLAAAERRFAFTSKGNVIAATVFMALLGGCLSLWFGQDANWDLRNYHLYNGYAALHGRLALDLAPAQMQSYFSPLLDVFQYLLMTRMPGPLSGFLMGMLHGLLFLPVAGIAWQVLEGRSGRARLVPLLAAAGLCMGAVLSEFGNTMADNSTALFVLGSVYLVLRAQSRDGGGRAAWLWLSAGALLGLAVALKLTNAIYAVGVAAAVLSGGAGWLQRLKGLVLVTLSALVVAALSAGWWYWQLWQAFGNPLFPQFNAFFQSPLAALDTISDLRWLPRNAWEQLVWPLVFTFNPKRVSEMSLVQGVWAALYVAGIALLVRRLFAGRGPAVSSATRPLRSVIVFFVVSYLLWQLGFSIQRYLAALELLAPLLLWCACTALLPSARGIRVAGWAVAACVVVSLSGRGDWGHERWAASAFEVQQPEMAEPLQSVVLLVGGEPQAWRVPLLPAEARYASVASGFPESEGYRARVASMLAERPQHFAIIPGAPDGARARFEALNAKVAMLGMDRGPDCARLEWLARRLKGLRAVVEQREGSCVLVPRSGPEQPIVQREAEERANAQARLAAYGLALAADTCVTLESRIGQGRYPYQWCRLQPAP